MVVVDLSAQAARAVIEEAAGGTAVAITGDLADQTVVDQVVKTAVDTFGVVDVLILERSPEEGGLRADLHRVQSHDDAL